MNELMTMTHRKANDLMATETNFRVDEGWKGIFYLCNKCGKRVNENRASDARMLEHYRQRESKGGCDGRTRT